MGVHCQHIRDPVQGSRVQQAGLHPPGRKFLIILPHLLIYAVLPAPVGKSVFLLKMAAEKAGQLFRPPPVQMLSVAAVRLQVQRQAQFLRVRHKIHVFHIVFPREVSYLLCRAPAPVIPGLVKKNVLPRNGHGDQEQGRVRFPAQPGQLLQIHAGGIRHRTLYIGGLIKGIDRCRIHQPLAAVHGCSDRDVPARPFKIIPPGMVGDQREQQLFPLLLVPQLRDHPDPVAGQQGHAVRHIVHEREIGVLFIPHGPAAVQDDQGRVVPLDHLLRQVIGHPHRLVPGCQIISHDPVVPVHIHGLDSVHHDRCPQKHHVERALRMIIILLRQPVVLPYLQPVVQDQYDHREKGEKNNTS